MKIRKQIIAVVCVICLTFGMVNSSYKEAHAFALGIPLEWILAMIYGTTCASSGVNIETPELPTIVLQLLEAGMDAPSQEVALWFENLTKKAVMSATGTTVYAALQAGQTISELDLKQYIIPLGEVVKLIGVVKNFIVSFICQKLGITELKGGTTIPIEMTTGITEVLNNCGVDQIPDMTDVLVKPYITVFKILNTNNFYEYIYVCGSSGLPYLAVNANKFTEMMIRTSTYYESKYAVYRYDSTLQKYKYLGISTSYGIGHVVYIDVNSDWTVEKLRNGILYNSYDMVYNGITLNKGEISKQIPSTSIELQTDTDLDTIPINNDLAADVAALNIDDISTTDELMLPVADTIADTSEKTETDIWQKIKDLPKTITDGVAAGLEKVFVPDATKVQEFVDTTKTKWAENAGIFMLPTELVVRFLNGLNELGKTDCILSFPKLEWMGHVLTEKQDFNLTEFFNREEFEPIYSKYLMIVNAIMIIAVVMLAKRKGEEILTGGLG